VVGEGQWQISFIFFSLRIWKKNNPCPCTCSVAVVGEGIGQRLDHWQG